MRINVDRLCELAGVPGARKTRGSRLMRESRYDEEEKHGEETSEGKEEDDGEPTNEKKNDPLDEIIEINEADLVKELRRARVMVRENKRRKQLRQQKLQEAQLKAVIDQEVKNVIKELQLTSGWVYGKKKPSRSRKGYTHQGSFLKGLGFK